MNDETGPVPAGTRVLIRWLVLEPADRAPGLPHDTARLPYQARARGVLLADAEAGGTAEIRTSAGRTLVGTIEEVSPADTHTFGAPPAALLNAIEAIHHLRRSISQPGQTS